MRDLPARLYARRHWAGAIFLIITAFFAFELRNLEIATQFHDLYPQNSEAVRLLEKYPAFGSPFTETILMKVKHGDIYNPVTLSKIQEATRLIDLIPGVDHNQIISIASRRVRHIEAVGGGIQSTNLLIGAVPQSQSQLADLRDRVRSTPGVIGTLVSFNGDAAVIQATFIDHLIDCKVVFDRTNQIISRLEDSNHDLYAFGQPMLTGWVYHYRRQTFVMFMLGLGAMVLLLALYFRNVTGVLVPTIVGCVSAIWGFGLTGLVGFNLDPLIVVVPILLVARALSHSVQMCERYFELYHERRDGPWTLKTSLSSLFAPGVGGILCDAAGIFLIGLAPVPLIRKLA
jgi:predicted RND superfamily exporter protein